MRNYESNRAETDEGAKAAKASAVASEVDNAAWGSYGPEFATRRGVTFEGVAVPALEQRPEYPPADAADNSSRTEQLEAPVEVWSRPSESADVDVPIRHEVAAVKREDGGAAAWGAYKVKDETEAISERTLDRESRVELARQVLEDALDSSEVTASEHDGWPAQENATSLGVTVEVGAWHGERHDEVGSAADGAHRTDGATRRSANEHVSMSPDLTALKDFTGTGYELVNPPLREGSISDIEAVADQIGGIVDDLQNRPIKEGTVLRTLSDTLTAAEIERYEPGEIVTENPFTSASTNPEFDRGGNVLWVIESRTGRDVADISQFPGEREVLFNRVTSFTVLAKEQQDTGRWLIYMEERDRLC